jgi:glycosyltransferase involved in cell wall biosynthesis
MSDSKEEDAIRIGWKENLKRVLIRQFKSAICAGAVHKEYLEKLGLPADRIFLGYDVVDNEYFFRQAAKVRNNPDDHRHLPGLGCSKPYFLASARFIKRKNLAFLLHAYEIYCQNMKSSGYDGNIWGLIVLGDGDERGALEKTIKELNIERVTLAGIQQIENLPAYYALAGAFIHPALQDQWGLVVNEAMASGLPVLVSRGCGCASELVENGVNGFVFDPTDFVRLSDLMCKISDNEYDLSSMGNSSLEKISHWGTDKFAEGIYQAFCVAFKS